MSTVAATRCNGEPSGQYELHRGLTASRTVCRVGCGGAVGWRNLDVDDARAVDGSAFAERLFRHAGQRAE